MHFGGDVREAGGVVKQELGDELVAVEDLVRPVLLNKAKILKPGGRYKPVRISRKDITQSNVNTHSLNSSPSISVRIM